MTRGWLAAALLLSAAGLAPAPAPPAPTKALSSRERAALLDALPPEEHRWLNELVAPIVTPEEERVFLSLDTPEDRARFREAFWARRERDGLAFPLGPGYRGRYESLRELADSKYDGWREDAGRMVLRHGEPAAIDPLEGCRTTFRNLEIWTYSGGSWPGTRRFFFYRIAPGAPRRLFSYGTPDSELLSPGSCRKSMADLGRACLRDKRSRNDDPCLLSDCADTCRVWELYQEIRTLQASKLGGESESAGLLDAPQISTEDLSSFKSTSPSLFRAAGPAASPIPTPTPPPTTKPAAASSAPGSAPKLSSREKAAKMKDLSEDDRGWLEYVEPIILPDETNLFLQLPDGYPKAMFREEFWKRRERDGLPLPFGPGYRSRYEHLLEVADSDYEGRLSDGGRLVVRRGEPVGIQEFKDCSEVFKQAEVWYYQPSGTTGKDLRFLFYRPSFGAPRRLWLPGDTEIFQTGSCVTSFDVACSAGPRGMSAAQMGIGGQCIGGSSVIKGCDSACFLATVAEEIRSRGIATVAAEASFAPTVSTEDLGGLWQRLATSTDPNARAIRVEGPSTAAASRAAVPEPTPEIWTQEVIRDRIIALPKKYRDFLDVAAPIMSETELVTFLKAKPSEREAFIHRFWRAHGKKG